MPSSSKWVVAVVASTLVSAAGCTIDDLTDGHAEDASAPDDGGRTSLGDAVVRADGPGQSSFDAGEPKRDASTCSSAYENTVLGDIPLAYYRMNETSGTLLTDGTPHHLDGAYGTGIGLGAAGLVPTSPDPSPHFPGGVYAANNVALVMPTAELRSSAGFAAELVFEEDAVNTGIVGDGFIDLASYGWSLQITPTNTLKLYILTSTMSLQANGTTQVTPGQSHHLVGSYDGTTARLYLDGQLEGSVTGSGTLSYATPSGAAGLSIGASPGQSTRAVLGGRIADVSVYDAPLSPVQVTAHFHATGLDGSGSCRSAAAPVDAAVDAHPVSDAGSTGAVLGFPRLASALISAHGSTDLGYDAAYIQWASKLNANIFGGWAGFGAEIYGGSREAFVTAIHSQSTIGTKMFQYYLTDNNNEYWPLDAASVNAWLLYESGTTGTCSQNAFDSSWCNTNQTLLVPANGDGLHLEGAFAKALIATVNGSGVDAEPSLDGVFHDNLTLTPTASGDYGRNGTTEAPGDPTAGAWIREGFAEGVDYLQAHSSLIVIGNISNWGPPASTGLDASSLAGKVQGGFIEGLLGFNWSIETWGGFAEAKQHYQFSMANTAAPRLVMVHHADVQANGSDPNAFDTNGNPTSFGAPYQAIRYGLAFTLMDDGYYATSQTANYYNTERNWFDEYAVDPATGVALEFPNVDSGLGYLGQPTDAAWPAPGSNGVYMRHFTNTATGKSWLVLLNPKGNGAQTVALGGSFKKLTATASQATTINDGAAVTSVSLSDRDGLILMAQPL